MSTLFLTTDEIRKHVRLSTRLYGMFFKGGMSWSVCTNLISSVSTTLHVYVPMKRRGTDRMHSMGGFCCCSPRCAMLIDVQLAPPLNCSALSHTQLVFYMEVTFEARSLDIISTLFLTTDEIRKHVCFSDFMVCFLKGECHGLHAQI